MSRAPVMKRLVGYDEVSRVVRFLDRPERRAMRWHLLAVYWLGVWPSEVRRLSLDSIRPAPGGAVAVFFKRNQARDKKPMTIVLDTPQAAADVAAAIATRHDLPERSKISRWLREDCLAWGVSPFTVHSLRTTRKWLREKEEDE